MAILFAQNALQFYVAFYNEVVERYVFLREYNLQFRRYQDGNASMFCLLIICKHCSTKQKLVSGIIFTCTCEDPAEDCEW